jgi:hypothetical protein
VVKTVNPSYRRPFLVTIVHGAKNRSLRKLDLNQRRKQETSGLHSPMTAVILLALVGEGRRDQLGGWDQSLGSMWSVLKHP